MKWLIALAAILLLIAVGLYATGPKFQQRCVVRGQVASICLRSTSRRLSAWERIYYAVVGGHNTR